MIAAQAQSGAVERGARVRPVAFRPPTRSITASATRIEGAASGTASGYMTDNLTASPTTSDAGYPRPGGTLKWSDPTNVYSANTRYASVYIAGESKTEYLRAGGFALSALPDDARIRGFVVSVRRYASASNTIKEAAVTMVKEDVTGFANRATSAYVGTSLTTVQYGSSTDDWGEPYPVPSSVKAANFGILVGYNNDEVGSDAGATIFVDHVEITVYYDPAPDCDGLTVTSAWAGSAGAQSGSWVNPSEAAGAPDTVVAVGTAPQVETTYLVCTNFDLDYIDHAHYRRRSSHHKGASDRCRATVAICRMPRLRSRPSISRQMALR
ncbi:MAG: hypothetical protein JNM80_01630 [Phycisphaerae bacterium]|nr:hypothetical protein [Phycisphaerae bacterium]